MILIFAVLTANIYSQDMETPVKEITVLIDDNYPPYIFRDGDGKLIGIIADQWKRWEEKTGIAVNLKGMDWFLAQEEMKLGNGDVIDTLFYTEERARLFDYSRPYAEIKVKVFTHNLIGGITDIKSLRGFSVGVKIGDAVVDTLKAGNIEHLVYYDNYRDLINGAVNGEVKVFCADEPPVHYFLYKSGPYSEFRSSFTLSTGRFHRAVAKGNSIMLQTVERGFSAIPAKEYRDINTKWLGVRIEEFIRWKKILLPGLLITAAVLAVILILAVLNKILNKKLIINNIELKTTVEHLAYSEEKNRQLLDALPDLYFILDPYGKYLDLKHNDPDLLAEPPDKLIGCYLYDLPFSDSFKKEVKVILRDVCENRKTAITEYDITVPAGDLTFEARVFPYDKNNSLWICRDITEQKKTEEQLRKSHKLETVGILAGGLAHDFNNILGGITGAASLIRYSIIEEKSGIDQLEHYVDIIEKSAERGADVVNQLLTLSSKRENQTIIFDLKDSIQRVKKICETTFDKRVVFAANLPDGNTLIQGDPAQIEQGLLNLCINGHDAMTVMRSDNSQEGGILSVDLEYHANYNKDTDFWKITVKDTGKGITKENLTKVFDPFFSEKGRGKGTGLGLTMVLSIVKQNNGEIEIESEPDLGTKISIAFPAVDFVSADTESEPQKKYNIKGSGLVLIIDDEPLIRDLVVKMLESAGYRTAQAENGIAGLEYFREHHGEVTAVILDMSMPLLSGLDTYKELVKIDSKVRVLLTSGFKEDERVKEGLQSGIRAFLQKPFMRSELLKTVREICLNP